MCEGKKDGVELLAVPALWPKFAAAWPGGRRGEGALRAVRGATPPTAEESRATGSRRLSAPPPAPLSFSEIRILTLRLTSTPPPHLYSYKHGT